MIIFEQLDLITFIFKWDYNMFSFLINQYFFKWNIKTKHQYEQIRLKCYIDNCNRGISNSFNTPERGAVTDVTASSVAGKRNMVLLEIPGTSGSPIYYIHLYRDKSGIYRYNISEHVRNFATAPEMKVQIRVKWVLNIIRLMDEKNWFLLKIYILNI